MLMIRKYFLILVISVATPIICEQTWSQVTNETCTIQHSYVTSVVPHWSLAVEWWSGLVPSPPKKKLTTPLKLHHWSTNSIREKCNYLNFKCWKPVLIIINYKFWIRIFLGSQIALAGCKVKSTLKFLFYTFFN